MDASELIKFKEKREATPADANLNCYGCAHSASNAPYPGKPSGERPCCSCVRNPERERWAREAKEQRADRPGEPSILIDDHGHARDFDPFTGSLYNGAPTVHFPMDNYVTLDQRDQEDWLDEHPEYAGAVTTAHDGTVKIVKQP